MRYKPEERIILRKLREADEECFIELAEKAGYLSTALGFYLEQKGKESLEKAVEIARQLEGIPLRTRRKLVDSLRVMYKKDSHCYSTPMGDGSLGDAYSAISAQNIREEAQKKLANLPSLARELGLKDLK